MGTDLLTGWNNVRQLEREVVILWGRLARVNVILSAIPLYLVSYVVLSHWAREMIDKIRSHFLWGAYKKRKASTIWSFGAKFASPRKKMS